ncbi:MAG: hypothetical protein COA37_07975 [Hoeflea sp.]|uniref:hypothetical protein n=1 Tax=Hoeflea sp. TaxID=1940281 RepID=UPI000C0D8E8F|nr:hypothetical protein [Hoeflea sp.]PHR23271.1 MAG: hypothetical protein COA37_07975 [Hoeflea sp.]
MLSARYHRLRDLSMTHNDRVFAEPLRFSFFVPGKMSNIVDTDRPDREIEGILRVDQGKAPAAPSSRKSQLRIHAQKAELYIDRSKYPDLVVRSVDRVQALARPGQPWFEVKEIDDRTDGRLVLQLDEAST